MSFLKSHHSYIVTINGVPKHISGDNMTISDIQNETVDINGNDNSSDSDSMSVISDSSSIDNISDDHMDRQHFQFVPGHQIEQPRQHVPLSPYCLRSGTVLRNYNFVKRH